MYNNYESEINYPDIKGIPSITQYGSTVYIGIAMVYYH